MTTKMSESDDSVLTWLEKHPATVSYVAFVVTIILILQVITLLTQ